MLFRLALFGLTLAAHGAVCWHDFIDMDDPQTIADNPRLKPPTLSNTIYYWQNRGLELYIPCTYTAWELIAAFSGSNHGKSYVLRPAGFHLANLFCHLLSVLVVYEILRVLLRSAAPVSSAIDVPAAIGAGLFAVHPLQVEAVAWATGLKDVLSGLAALVAIWQYLRAIDAPARVPQEKWIEPSSYAFATVAFAVAVLAKPAGVAAVGIAAVLDMALFHSRLRKVAWRLSPWLIIALIVALIAHHVQPAGEVTDNPLWLRPFLALDAVSFYIWKFCWPHGLCPDYGRRPTAVIDQGYIAWTWIVPLAVAWFFWSIRRKNALLLAGLAVALVGLSPTLGLVAFIYQRHSTVSDRYVYLAMLGPAIMFAWCAYRTPRGVIPSMLLIGALAVCTVGQESFWTDSLSLFAHAVRVSPSAPFNHLNYGVALADDGRLTRADEQFRETLILSPGNAQAQQDLALLRTLSVTKTRPRR